MFNSQMLDTAISLVFIYFFLSLLCSVIIEIVAGLTKKRARMLKVGISTLLQDETVVKKLYEHPLFVGKTPPGSAFSSFCQSFRTIPSGETKDGKEIVPSYISSRTFVLSLLESLKQHPDLVKKLLIDKNSTLDKKGKIKYFREKLKVLHDENKIKVELLTLLDVAEADSAKAPSAIQACYDKIVELPDILKEILKEIEGRSAVDTVENIKALVNILSDAGESRWLFG